MTDRDEDVTHMLGMCEALGSITSVVEKKKNANYSRF
jgi:hypothetical protein